ncbi:MAG TPA: oligosaccharide flippase family protein [Bacillaceae bacterium]
MNNKLLKGTVLLSSASMLSKILGFVYVIPFTALVGTGGIALYGYAYSPYVIMLSLSTMGIPLAVSGLVSKYYHMGQYGVLKKLWKLGIFLMVTSGVLCFLFLYFSAAQLADLVARNPRMGTPERASPL